MKKEFTKFEVAAIKRTAQNVSSMVIKKGKLMEKIEALQSELAVVEQAIEGWQAPIKAMTGGYTTEDLVVRTTVKIGTDKNGKDIMGAKFELKYPETIIPVEECTECKITVLEAAGNPETIPGADFDVDDTEMKNDIAAEEVATAPFEEEPIEEVIFK